MSITFSSAANSAVKERADMLGALLLAFCMFSTGGAGLVVEYILATTTTFILGGSIFVFSMVIGVMMGAMGLSGWVQEKIGNDLLVEKFFAIEVTLALAGGFAPVGLFWAYATAPDQFNWVLYPWSMFIGMLIGLEIPIVMRVIEQLGIGLRINLKYVFGADYLGAMVFMFLWVFWLLPTFPITEISFIVSGANFAVALFAITYFGYRGLVTLKLPVAVVALVAVTATVYGYTQNRTWSTYLEQRLYDDPIVFQTTTAYQHLVLTKETGARCGTEIRLYINGNTQFGSCDEHIYHDNLVLPAMNLAARPERVLIIGGGDGLAARDVLRHNPKSVTLVDLDPDMVELARTNPYLKKLNQGSFDNSVVLTPPTLGVKQDGGLFNDIVMETGKVDPVTKKPVTERVASVKRMHIDAGKFLESFHGIYDVIIIDLPDPSTVELSRLYTRGFYTRIRRSLAADGVVVIQSTSPIHAREVYLEIGRTLSAAGFETIPYHDNVPSFGEWGYWLGCPQFGCKTDLLKKLDSMKSFKAPGSYLTPERLRANLVFGQVDGVPYFSSATTHNLNTMSNPTMFMRYDQAWKSY